MSLDSRDATSIWLRLHDTIQDFNRGNHGWVAADKSVVMLALSPFEQTLYEQLTHRLIAEAQLPAIEAKPSSSPA